MNEWLLLVLLCFTVHRVTRLITTDEVPITKIPREAVVLWLYPAYAQTDSQRRALIKRQVPELTGHWGGFGRTLAYLIVCDWCMSMWIATVVLVGIWQSTSWLDGWSWIQAVMYGLTASTFTGVIAQREPE